MRQNGIGSRVPGASPGVMLIGSALASVWRRDKTAAGYLRHRIYHAHRKQEPEQATGSLIKD